MATRLLPTPSAVPPPIRALNTTTSNSSKRSDYLAVKTKAEDHPVLALLDDYSRLDAKAIRRIHGRMLRLGLLGHPYSASRLLVACSLSPSADLPYARQLFDHLPAPNLFTWNTLIRAHASGPDPRLALFLFSRLLRHSPHSPDKFTFPFTIKAAAELSALRDGTALHGMIAKSPLFRSDIFILNSLIHFYAACRELDLSLRVFEMISERDVVSWNSVITALAQGGRWDEALQLFEEMENENVRPNDVTMVSVASICGKKGDLELAKQIHSYIEQNGIRQSLILDNALLDMYVKCGSLEEAELLFDSMTSKDSISWTTMLVGYAKLGCLDAARRLFDQMPKRDIASWNALISCYEQSGHPKEALDLFHELQHADAKPDQVTLVAVLSACSQLGALEVGCWIHAYIKKNNVELNCHITTSLIDMYSKCGDLDKALNVFSSVNKRDVFVWSAMIAGLAMHGRGREALNLFGKMQEAKVKPNMVTFTNVFCACSHAGLVDEGRLYFSQMLPVYGIAPSAEHYSCMVDILGRAGLLEEATEYIESMPMPPGASAWGALLGACAIHKNVELGELACERLLELEPRNHGAYVILSNLYARSGKWDAVASLRKLMKDASLKKEAGCSLIEVHGAVHEFLVGDISHPLKERIYLQLDEIALRLKAAGYVPNRKLVLQDIEEDVKEKALYLHSEKLAIAFGLISTCSPAPIRITKNLRVCDDCHLVAKLVSSIYNRDIILRDRYRFHHFTGGSCSCMDYW
ncbi:pentatricopeptide repeat-containing protein [Canna indica]|uniref:Pentatricopeptide repeat-containing protein n=1 Tax=Canna indica TaxID=4628 RepID=A0AAQ3QPC5_9LILI|nr:pentatricopeptide repeat-containing protein [Canna indica]